MNSDVLVIGNGFDLAHGLPTRYDDFITCVQNYIEIDDDKRKLFTPEEQMFCKLITDNGFIQCFIEYTRQISGWVDIEKQIKQILSEFSKFEEVYRELFTSFDKYISFKEYKFMKLVFKNFGVIAHLNSIGFNEEYIIEPRYYNEIYGINKEEIKKLLINELDDLIKALELYLEKIMYINNEKLSENVHKIAQIEKINPEYVISFNYTDTYKIYGIEEKDVLHIHGRIGKENIVLGIDDEEPDNLEFIYFKKYFQRIQKLTGYIDTSRLQHYVNGCAVGVNVHFYGHSLDKTDGDIFLKLR